MAFINVGQQKCQFYPKSMSSLRNQSLSANKTRLAIICRYLANNKIARIHSGAFDTVDATQDIDLMGSPLKYLESNAFKDITGR